MDKETGHEACADKGREQRDDAERHRRDETRRELKLKTEEPGNERTTVSKFHGVALRPARRKSKRNIPNTDENNENTGRVADRDAKRCVRCAQRGKPKRGKAISETGGCGDRTEVREWLRHLRVSGKRAKGSE